MVRLKHGNGVSAMQIEYRYEATIDTGLTIVHSSPSVEWLQSCRADDMEKRREVSDIYMVQISNAKDKLN